MPKIKLQYQKMPGSYRQRKRARHLLKCHQIMAKGVWMVWGGEESHIVRREESGGFECDCSVYQVEQKLCSHIIKVQMELGSFPKEPKLVAVKS